MTCSASCFLYKELNPLGADLEMRVRWEAGGKQMRGCFVFSGDIGRRHRCLMHPMVLYFWTVSASLKNKTKGRAGQGMG